MKSAWILIAAAAAGSIAANAADEPGAKACMANLPSPTAEQMAAGKEWYWKAEPIEVFGKKYVKYGLPRVLQPGEVTHAADYLGVAVGVDAGAPTSREVVYVLTRAECEFQPYQIQA